MQLGPQLRNKLLKKTALHFVFRLQKVRTRTSKKLTKGRRVVKTRTRKERARTPFREGSAADVSRDANTAIR